MAVDGAIPVEGNGVAEEERREALLSAPSGNDNDEGIRGHHEVLDWEKVDVEEEDRDFGC